MCVLAVVCTGSVLIQQNVDRSNFFNRTWAEFKAGFGTITGNYWLGNDVLHQLTTCGSYKLHFDLQSLDTLKWFSAEYITFRVGNESTGYLMHAAGYTGNTSYDAFGYQSDEKFTTKDRDNDEDVGENCALRVK